MIYEFRDEQGERVEIEMPMGMAPALFDWTIAPDGRRVQRVPSDFQFHVDHTCFTALSQRPWQPGAKDYAPDGAPRFANKREAHEYAAFNGISYGEV